MINFIINDVIPPLRNPFAVLEATQRSDDPVSMINSIGSFYDPNYIYTLYST